MYFILGGNDKKDFYKNNVLCFSEDPLAIKLKDFQ